MRLPCLTTVLLLSLCLGCVERANTPTQAGSTTPVPPATTTDAASGTRITPCPTPKPDVACTKDFKPVVCDGCEYANACVAGAAGFKAEQCAPKAEADAKKACPTPAANYICTMEYAPVKCDGCVYPNACAAGAAGFKKEQCVPAPGED